MATPLTIERLGRVESTQDEARARYRGSPLLVTATGQSSGRGRTGSRWIDADRAVTASMALEPGWPAEALARVTLVAGLAVTDCLPQFISLKWPNDIMAGDLKVGGILTEAIDGLVVIGLGLNIFWSSPPPGMGAVHGSDPGEAHSYRTAEAWAGALLERIEAGPAEWGRDDYTARCSTIGLAIEWEPDGAGVAVGVADDGALVVDTDLGRVALHSGTVRDVRSA